MTKKEIYENLCYKDPRNPEYPSWYFDEEDVIPVPRSKCNCDNCFYGRDRLAIEILKLMDEKE